MTKIGTEEEAEMDRVKNTKSWRYWLLGVAAAAAALAGGAGTGTGAARDTDHSHIDL